MSTTVSGPVRLDGRVRDYPRVRAVIEQVVRRLVGALEPRRIILYGSYVHGRPTPDSDLDFLVITDSAEPNYRQSQHARQATAATTEGGVKALSAALGDLADEMATVLREIHAER